MGEFATRKLDGEDIKIGTEFNMYYLRHDQKKQITYPYFSPGKLHHFRLVLFDEKGILPGDFKEHNRGIRLEGAKKLFSEEFIESLTPGNVQVVDNYKRITILMPCYHGLKENPDLGKVKVQSSDEDIFLLTQIKEKEDGFLTFNIECSHCGKTFYLDEEEIPLLKSYFKGTSEKDLKLNVEYVLQYNENLKKEKESTY